MSIADKLTTVAENIPKVYDKGYEDGKNSVVCFERFATEVIFSEGDDESWGAETTTINLDNALWLNNFFAGAKNAVIKHLVVNCPKPQRIKAAYRMFYLGYSYQHVMEHITLNVDFSKATTLGQAFYNMPNLKIIDGTPLDLTSSTNNSNFIAQTCSQLYYVRFVANSIYASIAVQSPALDGESIQSVIDGLADITDGTAQTLTLHADVGAKLTDEQKATITAKNWTLVY